MQGFEASLPPPKHKRSTDEVFSEPQRLHKVLASCGFGSRRGMEELILAGRITVNRMPADIGQKVGPGDEVRINGEPVKIRFAEPKARVLVYHKPTGELVTRDDPDERPTVFGMLPEIKDGRWIAVGRLDYNTEGLLLFTNSGELANRLMHPRYEVEREYAVRVMGRLTDEQVATLKRGVELEDGPAKCERVEDAGGDDDASNHWYKVVVKEGRNREVRRLFEAIGLTVSRLIRVRYGRVAMPPPLKRSEVMELEPQEVAELLNFAGLKAQGGGAEPQQGARPAGGKANKHRRGDGQHGRPPGGQPGQQQRGGAHGGQPGAQRGRPHGGQPPGAHRGGPSGAPQGATPFAQPQGGPGGDRPGGSRKRRRGRKRSGPGAMGGGEGAPDRFNTAPGERPPVREVNGNVAPGPGSAYRQGEGPMSSHRGAPAYPQGEGPMSSHSRGPASGQGPGSGPGQKKRRRRGRGGGSGGNGGSGGGAKGPATQQWVGLPKDEDEGV